MRENNKAMDIANTVRRRHLTELFARTVVPKGTERFVTAYLLAATWQPHPSTASLALVTGRENEAGIRGAIVAGYPENRAIMAGVVYVAAAIEGRNRQDDLAPGRPGDGQLPPLPRAHRLRAVGRRGGGVRQVGEGGGQVERDRAHSRIQEVTEEIGGPEALQDRRAAFALRPGTQQYLLVERNSHGARGYWLSTHPWPESAGEYIVTQEYGEDWETVALVDLDTGGRFDVKVSVSWVPQPAVAVTP